MRVPAAAVGRIGEGNGLGPAIAWVGAGQHDVDVHTVLRGLAGHGSLKTFDVASPEILALKAPNLRRQKDVKSTVTRW